MSVSSPGPTGSIFTASIHVGDSHRKRAVKNEDDHNDKRKKRKKENLKHLTPIVMILHAPPSSGASSSSSSSHKPDENSPFLNGRLSFLIIEDEGESPFPHPPSVPRHSTIHHLGILTIPTPPGSRPASSESKEMT